MAEMTEAMQALLRELAQSVAGHRGSLDDLPPRQKEMLQAMDEAQRRVFMDALAQARAEAGRGRFRASLDRWRARQEAPPAAKAALPP